ncbi:MAG: hypothetical protein FLDDKLPJ_00363 [Phycisphaerae bacterium]|nr:hypothetical protein [Phycisphaerae bacterium]
MGQARLKPAEKRCEKKGVSQPGSHPLKRVANAGRLKPTHRRFACTGWICAGWICTGWVKPG